MCVRNYSHREFENEYFHSIYLVPSGVPQNITLMDDDPAMLLVMYRRPEQSLRNGQLTGFMIRYTRVDTGESQVMNVSYIDVRTVTSTISGLVAFTNYSVEVAAVNINGTGPFSDAVYGLSGQNSEYNNYNYKLIIIVN